MSGLKGIVLALVLLVATGWAEENILIIRSEGAAFKEVAQSIQFDLSQDLKFTEKVIEADLKPKMMKKVMEENTPKLVVLMNNSAVRSYKEYQKESGDKTPSLSLMTALLPAQIKGMENAIGITYEVPIVTSVVNLRSMLNIENVKLGVIYREFLKPFIDENAQYCKRENIAMIRGFVPQSNDKYGPLLKKGLEMFVSENVGANIIWVPNDPAFLTPEIIRDVWVPFSEKHAVPIIVGVESMLTSSVNSFGTYAVLPDHIALGAQAAELIRDIKAGNWTVEEAIVEPPISIYQVMNPKKIETKYEVGSENLEVDKVIK